MGIYKPKKQPPKNCTHPRSYVKTRTNRKGKKFRECDKCNAFLGFVK